MWKVVAADRGCTPDDKVDASDAAQTHQDALSGAEASFKVSQGGRPGRQPAARGGDDASELGAGEEAVQAGL